MNKTTGKKTAGPDETRPPFKTLKQARKVAAAITAIDGRPRAIIRQEARGDFAVRVGVPCQLGADDRLVEWSGPVTHVTRIDVCGRAPTWRFRYVCSCGWAGDKRRVQMTAERDGTVHEAAMAGQAQARAIERRAAKPAPDEEQTDRPRELTQPWHICQLPGGKLLSATIHGTPFIEYPGRGLRPAGWCGEVLSHVEAEERSVVRLWLELPTDPHDPMSAIKAKAARDFSSRPVWPAPGEAK